MDHTRLYLRRGRQSALAIFIFMALLLAGAQAAWAYTAVIYSPAHPNKFYTVNFDTFEELFAAIEADPPANHIPGFDSANDPLKARVNYGGAMVTLDIPAGSNAATLSVPALGLTKTFTEADRTALLESVETYVTTDPEGSIASLDSYVGVSSDEDGTTTSQDDGFNVTCFITTVFRK